MGIVSQQHEEQLVCIRGEVIDSWFNTHFGTHSVFDDVLSSIAYRCDANSHWNGGETEK